MKKCCWYWSGRSASDQNCYLPNRNSLFVCGCEEMGYEKILGNTVVSITNSDEADWSCVLDDVVAILRPCDPFYAIEDLVYWARDMDFKMQMSSRGWLVFLDWDNVEAFAWPIQDHGDFYISRPAWWPPYECCQVLSFLSPPFFAYY